ncbi:MAG TPA: DUF4157 domain-containing protein [Kofleriaceae bacterium]|nr:DUF4157 domain-containing protein [Kofleriaceae bacterium]
MAGRDREYDGGEISGEEEVEGPGRPSPGKVTSTSLIGNSNPPRYGVSPGKRSLTMGMTAPRRGGGQPSPDAQAGVSPAMEEALATEAGAPLTGAAEWSRRIGADVSDARIATGPVAAAAAASIPAPAFTVGNRVFLGDGVTTSSEAVMRHELTHVAQQRGGAMPDIADLTTTSPSHDVESQARQAEVGGAQAAQPVARSAVQIAPIGFPGGRMGPGGGTGVSLGTTPNPQLDAFKYFEKHGKAHFAELKDLKMGDVTLETGSPYVTWTGGSSKGFSDWFSYELFINVPPKPWDLLEKTIVPADVWKVVDVGRDAANPDDPAKANEYALGVTIEMQKAYRERLRESLARLMPRVVREWNRRTLADHAERSKDTSEKLPEHPETNQPGVGILQSHPIDRYVLGTLTNRLTPDFAAYRKAFPSEAAPRGGRDDAPAALRKVKFAWQSPNQARRWIKVTDPIDATPEEVAKELFGDTLLTYLVTPAAPLFGLDPTKNMFVPEHEAAYSKFTDDKSPGGSNEHQILSGPQADDAALNQAAGFSAGKSSPAAVVQQLDILLTQLKSIAATAATWITLDKDMQETVTRIEARKQRLASSTDAAEAGRWNAQVREQLDIAQKCERGLGIATKLFQSFPDAKEGRDLAHEIGSLFVKAAGTSDLVVTARQQLDQANQRLLAFPTDWMEAMFRWIRRAILASQKNARTGEDNTAVKQLGEKETKLRLDLMKLREKLLTEPLTVKDEVDKIFKELQELATGASAARNMDLCDETFVAVKEAKSPTGWIRGLASNPVTGDHGNDRLEALAGRADKFQGEWNIILKQWKDGDKEGAAKALGEKAKSAEWKQFFNDVAKEIKDQARYDAWMTFGILVGVAIIVGFAGAVLEPVLIGAMGPILGVIVTATTEAAAFTTMSYFLVEKHPTLEGFKNEFGKNLLVFGVMKGISKGWGALEKLIGFEMKSGEMIAQFATVNGIALYEANHKKAEKGETLTEGEILKISFDNLIFMIAVSLGGKALAPAFGRWRLSNQVGKDLAKFESLHQEVMSLAEQAKASKDKAVGEKLLERQRELLEAARLSLDGLVDLARKGWDTARKAGMTRPQFDAVVAAEGDLTDASRSLREAEIMGKLDPVSQNQYLAEPATFDEAREHFGADKANKLSEVTHDVTGARSFEVTGTDGSKMRISERAGKPGEVGTGTTRVVTPGGEPPPVRPEAKAEADSKKEEKKDEDKKEEKKDEDKKDEDKKDGGKTDPPPPPPEPRPPFEIPEADLANLHQRVDAHVKTAVEAIKDAPAEVTERLTRAGREAAENTFRLKTGAKMDAAKARKQAGDAAKRAIKELAPVEAEAIARARADQAMADGSAFDTSKLPRDAKTQLDDFNAGTSGGAAKRLAPQLSGKDLAAMETTLDVEVAQKNATKTPQNIVDPGDPSKTQKQLVYEFGDGTIIRLKPKGDVHNVVNGVTTPMFSIEVKQVAPGNAKPGQDGIAFKVNARGQAVPKGVYEIKNPYEKGLFQLQFKIFEQTVLDASHQKANP